VFVMRDIQCLCTQDSVFMWAAFSVHVGDIQCLCERHSVFMWATFNVYVGDIQCSCAQDSVSSIEVCVGDI
jgi:hypothetical protein